MKRKKYEIYSAIFLARYDQDYFGLSKIYEAIDVGSKKKKCRDEMKIRLV